MSARGMGNELGPGGGTNLGKEEGIRGRAGARNETGQGRRGIRERNRSGNETKGDAAGGTEIELKDLTAGDLTGFAPDMGPGVDLLATVSVNLCLVSLSLLKERKVH